jgi:hypothetical protein
MKKIIQVPKIEIDCDICANSPADNKCVKCQRDFCDKHADVYPYSSNRDIIHLVYNEIICSDCLKELKVIPKGAYQNLTDCSSGDIKPFIDAKMTDYIVMLRGEGEFQLDICETVEQCNKSLGEFATDYHVDGYENTLQVFHNGKEHEYKIRTCGFVSDNDDGTVTTKDFNGKNKEIRKVKGR